MATPPIPPEPGCITAGELLRQLEGRLTYRMFDYWCRTGWVQLKYDSKGSGYTRFITPKEAKAIHLMMAELESLREREMMLANGTFFNEAMEAEDDDSD